LTDVSTPLIGNEKSSGDRGGGASGGVTAERSITWGGRRILLTRRPENSAFYIEGSTVYKQSHRRGQPTKSETAERQEALRTKKEKPGYFPLQTNFTARIPGGGGPGELGTCAQGAREKARKGAQRCTSAVTYVLRTDLGRPEEVGKKGKKAEWYNKTDRGDYRAGWDSSEKGGENRTTKARATKGAHLNICQGGI